MEKVVLGPLEVVIYYEDIHNKLHVPHEGPSPEIVSLSTVDIKLSSLLTKLLLYGKTWLKNSIVFLNLHLMYSEI